MAPFVFRSTIWVTAVGPDGFDGFDGSAKVFDETGSVDLGQRCRVFRPKWWVTIATRDWWKAFSFNSQWFLYLWCASDRLFFFIPKRKQQGWNCQFETPNIAPIPTKKPWHMDHHFEPLKQISMNLEPTWWGVVDAGSLCHQVWMVRFDGLISSLELLVMGEVLEEGIIRIHQQQDLEDTTFFDIVLLYSLF